MASKKATPRQYHVVHHRYSWMDKKETQQERNDYLNAISQSIEKVTRQEIQKQQHRMFIQDIPPGIGKSYAAAPLTSQYDLGYFVERHDMPHSVPALQQIPEAQKPNEHNCLAPNEHIALTTLGYQAPHPGEPYWQQFKQQGSMLYVHNYLSTPHPLRHQDGWIIDEFKLDIFFPTEAINLEQVASGTEKGSYGRRLIEAIQKANADVGYELHRKNALGQWHTEMRGKAVFDLVNEALDGQLTFVLHMLHRELSHLAERPKADIEDATDIQHLPGTGLMKIVRAMHEELYRWSTGCEFNSLIALNGREMKITRRLRPYHLQDVPSITLLDATSNPRILSRVFPHMPIQVNHQDIDPPPDLKHIWVHTGARWGKTALVDRSSSTREQQRAISTVQLIMRKEQIVPQRLGVISYEKFTKKLGEALGAKAEDCLYFHNLRGSNQLEACDVLVVVGTPTPALDEVIGTAQAIFYRDQEPIVDYEDERFQFVLHHLVLSELAQACHRNRPLRYHGRTVITLAAHCPQYLPVTHEVVELPFVNKQGQDVEERLEVAVEVLEAKDEKVTCRSLQKESGVKRDVVAHFLRNVRSRAA